MPSSSSSESTPADPRIHPYERPFAGLRNSANRDSAGDDPQFDVFDWYPRYQSCQRYFLDHAQHSVPVQALSAFLNIRLPFQRQPNPVPNSNRISTPPSSSSGATPPGPPFVSLVPYIRRLVATGMDFP